MVYYLLTQIHKMILSGANKWLPAAVINSKQSELMRWPTLSHSTIDERNLAIENQFFKEELVSYDVVGDGNCPFKSVSVILNSSEDSFASPRKSITTYMVVVASSSIFDVSPGDNLPITKHINDIKNNRVWVGEDVVLATLKFSRRELNVYIAAKASSLLINARSLLDKSFFLISLVFYELVHYCVIISKADILACSTFSSNSGKQMIEGARRKLHSSSTLNACYFNTRG